MMQTTAKFVVFVLFLISVFIPYAAITADSINQQPKNANFAFVRAVEETAFYVSLTGTDATGDGSLTNPYRNLSYAVERVGKPGATIYLRGGRYVYPDYAHRDEVWIRQDAGLGGSNGQFFTIAPYPGETVELVNVRIIIDASWVRVRDLRFFEIGPGAVNWHGQPTHVELLNNYIEAEDIGYGAIEFMADNSLVEGNVVNLTGSSSLGTLSHGLYLHHGKNNIVRRNTILGATGYGIHVYDEDKYPGVKVEYRNVVIDGNVVSGSRDRSEIIVSGATGVTIDGVSIRNNIILKSNHVGISVGSYGATIANIQIVNNTFYQNGSRSGIVLWREAGSVSGVTIHNNLFDNSQNTNCLSNCSWYQPVHIAVAAAVANVTASHNLYFPESLGLSGVTDSNPVYGDPLFVQATSNNFHLQADSPAINAGLAAIAPANDQEGLVRDANPDIGAYEYNAAANSTVTPTPPPPATPSPVATPTNLPSATTIPTPAATATPGTPLNCTMTINHGAKYTNQRSVQVFATVNRASRMLLSNDAGFAGSSQLTYQSPFSWMLSDPGNNVVTLLVYARFFASNGQALCGSAGLLDDIVYDPQPPTLAVRVANGAYLRSAESQYTLQISASDQNGGSGVDAMQISDNVHFVGASWEPFASQRTVTGTGGDRLYVRVRDAASNLSETVEVTLVAGKVVFLPMVRR